MDDQSHIFQLLFQEQIDEYKQSLTSIDDLFEQKQKKEEEHPVTITESIDYLYEKDDFLSQSVDDENNGSPGSSTAVSGFIIDEQVTKEESQSIYIGPNDGETKNSSRTSFSCNGTSELPRHIQDVRERVKRELGVTANLHLTDEERKLLADEGVELPEDLPLTKAEERILKKVRRKIRNKRSAMASRRRKKEYISNVEEKYVESKDENDELKKRVKFLEQQNFNLMTQLRKLRESVMSLPKSGHACALGVVFFSLFVFCYPGGTGPFMMTFTLAETENFDLTRLDAFKSRRILQVDAAGLDYDYPGADTLVIEPVISRPENETDAKNKTEVQQRKQKTSQQQQLHHTSIMPESPEEHAKLLALKQGEM